jgi:hypothetical protein
MLPTPPLSHISPLSKKTQVFQQLQRDIPQNEFGLPEYLYRPDLIPPDLFDLPEVEQHSLLAASSLSIHYFEGFPALESGEPIWAQLPFEPTESHVLFTEYLQIPFSAPLHNSSRSGSTSQSQSQDVQPSAHDQPVRVLSSFATFLNQPLPKLQEMFHTYWWKPRAKAYDLFIAAATRRRRQLRADSLENQQYLLASEFIKDSQTYLRAAFADPETFGLRPADVINLMKMMFNAQRVSVGLPAHGLSGSKGDAENQAQNMEVIFRDLSIPNRVSGGSTRESDVKQLLSGGSPDELQRAQELIIKFTSSGTGRPSDQNNNNNTREVSQRLLQNPTRRKDEFDV